MDRLQITGLDVRVELRLTGDHEHELAERLCAAWSRCIDGPASRLGEAVTLTLTASDVAEDLIRGSTRLAAAQADSLITSATQSVTASVITAQAGNLLMFHAGAVSHPVTGASLVFVAPGGTGKTTLARVLGRKFGYLTDETVGIDREGRILPYPKPLSIRPDPSATHKMEHSPDALGLRPAHPEPFVSRIILLGRSDDHRDDPHVEELSLLDAITALAPETSSLSALNRGLAFCADVIERTGPALRVRYAEAESVAVLAAQLIGGVT